MRCVSCPANAICLFPIICHRNNFTLQTNKNDSNLMCSQSAKRNQRDRVIRALFAHKMLQKQLQLVHLMCFMFGLALLSAELFWAWQL